jgi:O-antigen/teichoic acid export membrane protein
MTTDPWADPPDRRPRELAHVSATHLQRNSRLLMISSVIVGLGNYGFYLAILWLLPSVAFSHVASATSLLVIVGTASSAVLPLLVARTVARTRRGSHERQQAVGFSLSAAIILGVIVGAIMAALAAPYAPFGIILLLLVTSIELFVAGVGSGYLIGEERFWLVAALSVGEVAIKIGAGVTLAVAGFGATGAFAGSAFGAFLWAAAGVWIIRRDVTWRPSRPPAELWHQFAGFGATQILVSALTTMDVVVGSIVIGARHDLSTYQAMLVFARVPMFISIAAGAVVFPSLAGDRPGQNRLISAASTMYLALAVAYVAVVATVPSKLASIVLPHVYLGKLGLLVPMTLAGLAGGQLNLSTTFLQAHLSFRSMLWVLLPALPVVVLFYALFGTSIGRLAWLSAGALSGVALIVLVITVRHYGPARLATTTFNYVVVLAVAEIVLTRARTKLPVWLALAIVAVVLGLLASRTRGRRPGPLRVLLVEPRWSGSNEQATGLSTVQDALVAEGLDVQVATAIPERHSRAPGADGRKGSRWRDFPRQRQRGPTALLRLVLLLHRYHPDLVVECVRAPFLGVVTPWLHRDAAVAVVCGVRDGCRLRHRRRGFGHWVLQEFDEVLDWSPVVSDESSTFIDRCRSACTRALAVRGISA